MLHGDSPSGSQSPSRSISRAPVRETHYARAYMRYGEDFLCFLRSGFPPAPSARTLCPHPAPALAPVPRARTPRPRPRPRPAHMRSQSYFLIKETS